MVGKSVFYRQIDYRVSSLYNLGITHAFLYLGILLRDVVYSALVLKDKEFDQN